MDQDLENRINFLEGEVNTLETIMAVMVAAMVSNRLIDDDLLRKYIKEHITIFTLRQYDDLIVGTPGEHYFKGAIQVLERVGEKLPK